MRYNELPKWAQEKVKRNIKQQYLEMDEEARKSGEDVQYYTEKELEALATEYLNDTKDYDDYDIEYDEETGEKTLILI